MIFDADTLNYDNIVSIINKNNLKYFDFGTSHGGGMQWINKHTGWKGLGFDIDEKKLLKAHDAGLMVTSMDISSIPGEKIIPVVTIFHMLEHLNSKKQAWNYISTACRIASDTVIIKQPYCDSDCILLQYGFKTFYSDWTGHQNLMTTADFYHKLSRMQRSNIIKNFYIGYKKPILNSEDTIIHSLLSPCNSLAFDEQKYPPKNKNVTFNFPLYYEIMVAIDLKGGWESDYYKIIWNKLNPEKLFTFHI